MIEEIILNFLRVHLRKWHMKTSNRYSKVHRKRRFEERYNTKYKPYMEKKVLDMIRSKNSGKYLYAKTSTGDTVFQIKINNKLTVFPVYRSSDRRHKKILTYLTKDMVDFHVSEGKMDRV